jgi:hypothetical protein
MNYMATGRHSLPLTLILSLDSFKDSERGQQQHISLISLATNVHELQFPKFDHVTQFC